MESSISLKKLSTLHQTLHLLHHRNKNQHRLTKWYKSLSEFRRHTQKFISEIQNYTSARNLSKKSKFTKAIELRLRGRLGFCYSMVERWYFAFSTLVADNQYASLGLMLIGCLARFHSVVSELRDEFGPDIEMLGDEGTKEVEEGSVVQVEQEGAEEDDLGEVISRNDVFGGFDRALVQDETPVKSKKKRRIAEGETKAEETVPKKPHKKKKKRNKGDAFDDLFGSLI